LKIVLAWEIMMEKDGFGDDVASDEFDKPEKPGEEEW
jgi:hypothetical protein